MEVKFEKAKFSSRILAFGADLIAMVATGLGLVIAAQAILQNIPFYKEAGQVLNQVQLDSGLYIEQNKDVVALCDYYKPQNQDQYKVFNDEMNVALTDFYKKEQFFEDTAWASQHYLDLKINSGLFIYTDDSHTSTTPVSEDEESLKKMFEFYGRTITQDATIYIVKYPGYVEATKTLNLSFIFLILLLPIFLTVTIWEFIVPLIFGNGRRTLGKFLFKISVVDARGLSPTFSRFFLRFVFFLFVEVYLSMVSFLIPLIVSFSMFVFNKNNQSLHDYVIGTYVVDSGDKRVFKNEKEYLEAQKQAKDIDLQDKTIAY